MGKDQGSGKLCRYPGSDDAQLAQAEQGLRHARIPSGTILIRYRDIDDYLEQFCDSDHQINRMVDDVMKEFAVKKR